MCFGSPSIRNVKRRPIRLVEFGWIWADNISLYSLEFIRLLLSFVISSVNTSDPVPPDAYECFASWCELSVFAIVKSSLYGSLGYCNVYLLESVLHLAGFCEGFFLHHGNDPAIIHRCCLLWMSRPLMLRSSPVNLFVFFSQNVPDWWFGHSWCSCNLSDGFLLFLQPKDGLFQLHWELVWPHVVDSQ